MAKKKVNKISARKKKNINIVSSIIFFVFCLVSLMLFINIFKLNMFPFKITFLLFTVEIIALIIFGVLCLHKKIKWKIKIVSCVILVIISLGTLFANHYIDRTISFLKEITNNNYEVENYYILVLKESTLNAEKDLLDKKVGYVSRVGSNQEAIEDLKEVVAVESVDKKDIFELGNSLLNSKVDAILIADSYKAILDEEIENFDSKVKVIYEFSIKKEMVVESTSVDVTKDSFNIFLSGIDTYGEIDSVARSDVNMVVTINPVTKQVLLTSIPRDYYVELSCYGEKDKLTHAGIYGVDCSIGTIENLLDIDINYYVRVNFSSLINIVDVLDGINVYSEYSFDTYGYKFNKGYNYLNGEYALAFSRARYNFVDGDRQRVKNQQAVITAIVNKAMSPIILNKYTSILESLKGSFQTNMGMSEIQKLAKFQIDKMPNWQIASISLNGSDSEGYTYSYGDQKLYVMEPDLDTITSAQETIDKVILGQEIDINSTVTDTSVNNITTKPTTKKTTTTTTTVKTAEKLEEDDKANSDENDDEADKKENNDADNEDDNKENNDIDKEDDKKENEDVGKTTTTTTTTTKPVVTTTVVTTTKSNTDNSTNSQDSNSDDSNNSLNDNESKEE